MLISSKNADLGRTVRKPGTSFPQATQTENPGPKTEFGLVNRPTCPRKEDPRAAETVRILPSGCMWKEEWEKYKSISQMFLEEIALFVFVQSPSWQDCNMSTSGRG